MAHTSGLCQKLPARRSVSVSASNSRNSTCRGFQALLSGTERQGCRSQCREEGAVNADGADGNVPCRSC